MGQSFLITSGKGGVGKSTLAANLGLALAQRGHSTVIMDLDLGLRAQDTFFSLENRVVYDLMDVSRRDCTLAKALLPYENEPRLEILPAAQFARSKELKPEQLLRIMEVLKMNHDFVLLDSPAGIERGLRNILNAGVDRVLLIATPDDLCIRDAERVWNIMEEKQLDRPQLIVNRLDNDLIYAHEMYAARVVAETLDLPLFGEIPDEPLFYRQQLKRGFILDVDCEARMAVRRIAARMEGLTMAFPDYGCKKPTFWKRFLQRKIKTILPDNSEKLFIPELPPDKPEEA